MSYHQNCEILQYYLLFLLVSPLACSFLKYKFHNWIIPFVGYRRPGLGKKYYHVVSPCGRHNTLSQRMWLNIITNYQHFLNLSVVPRVRKLFSLSLLLTWSKDFSVISVAWEWRLQIQSHISKNINRWYSQHNFSAFCHASILEVHARDSDVSFVLYWKLGMNESLSSGCRSLHLLH